MDFDELDDFELLKARDELKERLARARSGKGFATESEKERQQQEMLERQAEAERLQAEEEAAELERLRLEDEAKLQSSYMSMLDRHHYFEDDAETEGNESEDQEESEEESDDLVREALPEKVTLQNAGSRPGRGNFSSMLSKAQEIPTASSPSTRGETISTGFQDTGKRSSRGMFSRTLEKVAPSIEEDNAKVPSLRSVLMSLELDAEAEVESQAGAEEIAASRQMFYSLGEQRRDADDEIPRSDRQEELRADYEAWLNRNPRQIDEDEDDIDMHLDVDRPTRLMSAALARQREKQSLREERKRRVNELAAGAIFGDHKARVRAVAESLKAAAGDGARTEASAPVMPRSQAIGGGASFVSGLAFGPGVSADVADVPGLEARAPLPSRMQTKQAAKPAPVSLVPKVATRTQTLRSSQHSFPAAAGEASASSSSAAWKRRGAAARRREAPTAASSSSTSP
mmetsp:Transcript_155635/g.290487  ORF Transcript_155635/g.290487 Transcript_155635/m.290487 type:complete len:458 (+) Transcript_155635:159-1532(+)